MSGICGIYSPRNPSLATADFLARMLAAMPDLGARSERSCVIPAKGLALAVSTRNAFREAGSPPSAAWFEDENLIVALEGTIIDGAGESEPDLEPNSAAVAAAYRRAAAFPEPLRGCYALSLWDAGRREMHLNTDSLGSRPLCYYHSPTSGLFVFASRLEALLQHPAVPREIDRLSVQLYLARGAIFAPYSIYRDVRKLLPGEALTVGATGRLDRRVYRKQTAPPSDEAAVEDLAPRLRQEMTKAVARVAGRGREVGLMLSSGVDSAALLSAIKDAGGDCVAYTLSYADEGGRSESARAAEVAAAFGVPHRTVVAGEIPPALLSDTFERYDEPAEASRGLTYYLLSQAMAADGVFACLDGTGAENVYGGMAWQGYPRARAVSASDWEAVDRLLSRPTFFSVEEQSSLLGDVAGGAVTDRILKPFEELVEIDDPYERYNATLSLRLPTGRHGLHARLVPPAHGVEVRQPLRDQRLLDFGRGLPFELKEGAGYQTSRQLLRVAYGDRLPHLLEPGDKSGLPGLPRTGRASEGIDRLLLPALDRLRETGIFRSAAIEKVQRKYGDPQRSQRTVIKAWVLFCFQCWYDLKVDVTNPFA